VWPQPGRSRQIEFQVAVFDRTMVSFANVTKEKDSGRHSGDISCSVPVSRIGRRGDGESDRIPKAFLRRPAATTCVSEVAECFQDVLRRTLAFVPGRHAVATPSRSQRKPSRVGPVAIFQFRNRHEVRAGHFNVLRLRNVGTGNCNQLEEVWPVSSDRAGQGPRRKSKRIPAELSEQTAGLRARSFAPPEKRLRSG
jgi:hypothetical protein